MKYDIIAFVIKARERLHADKTLDVYIVIDGYHLNREKSTISLWNFSDNSFVFTVFVSYKRNSRVPGILGLNSGG